jgi:putative transposase
MKTSLVLDALDMAIWARGRSGVTDFSGLIHHNDAGSNTHR